MSRRNDNRVGFHTGLYSIDYFQFPSFPYKGNVWHVELCRSDRKNSVTRTHVGKKTYSARELAIFARNRESAQRAADLIHSSRLLLEGSNVMSHLDSGEHIRIWPIEGPDEEESGDGLRPPKSRIATTLFPLAGMIAAKASLRSDCVYALAKLRVSIELASVALMDLDPAHSENIPKSPFPEDQVRMAHALGAAWSCVEELGYEVRASAQRPSKLPNGTWNPPIKADLERRLREGRIDLAEPFGWNLRGPRTRIERKKPPQIFTRSEWARWNVRDGEMQLIDAINQVSFMRSWIATHKSDKQLLRVLSIYDIVNAQFLARRLLLETLGFWRYSHPPLKP